jgi:ABC-2 type transport system ATP-binding protein
MILTEGITKSFGDVKALRGVDLTVDAGTVVGMLGPNGAGKTTAVRILTTLLRPDAGRARVAGYDVVRDAQVLRGKIGLAGQSAAVDETLTGRENLEMVGRLYHVGRAEALRRADAILERFGLTEAANRPVKTYSGGMRRRVDLGASLVGQPEVLFLDEPTTGLDPRSRLDVWDLIQGLVKEGTTLLLTTQYLDEADVLSDRIAVIDNGSVIAEGTADELKSRVGGAVVEMLVVNRDDVSTAAGETVSLGAGGAQVDKESGRITIPAGEEGPTLLTEVVRRMDAAHIAISDLSLRRPTLDDVFLALTGHTAEDDHSGDPSAGADGKRRRGRRGRGRGTEPEAAESEGVST